MRYGSVCSGIEAASVAWQPLGWEAAWLAETDPHASRVLANRFPVTPNLGDMTALPDRVLAGEIEAPDILVGGTPCQSFSIAGLRGGMDDPRGGLALVFVRLANAIDTRRCALGLPAAIIVWENVPGVLSHPSNPFGAVLAGLAGEDDPFVAPGRKWPNFGYVSSPARRLAWRVLDAQYFGVPQRRTRVFVVASARDGFRPEEVLFERESRAGDSSARGGEAQEIAGTVAGGARKDGGYSLDDVPLAMDGLRAYGGNNTSGPLDVATARLAHDGSHGRLDFETETFIVEPDAAVGLSLPQAQAVCITGTITHTLRARGMDASEDGTGRGQPIVAAEEISSSVRRLTPRECERLQGFPDDWTRVPLRKYGARRISRLRPADLWEKIDGEWWFMTADGPRYRMVGNSMAVPCMAWIGRRISTVMEGNQPPLTVTARPYF